MNSIAGIWIDYQEAVIVILASNGHEYVRVWSNAEKPVWKDRDLGKNPISAQDLPMNDARESEYKADLDTYYDKVKVYLENIDEVLIFGPGEAKNEFVKRIPDHVFHTMIVETTDKMTVPEVIEHIRLHFYPTRFQLISGLAKSNNHCMELFA